MNQIDNIMALIDEYAEVYAEGYDDSGAQSHKKEKALRDSLRDHMAMIRADREVMRQALEAWEADTDPAWECNSRHPKVWTAIAALRERLKIGKEMT